MRLLSQNLCNTITYKFSMDYKNRLRFMFVPSYKANFLKFRPTKKKKRFKLIAEIQPDPSS